MKFVKLQQKITERNELENGDKRNKKLNER